VPIKRHWSVSFTQRADTPLCRVNGNVKWQGRATSYVTAAFSFHSYQQLIIAPKWIFLALPVDKSVSVNEVVSLEHGFNSGQLQQRLKHTIQQQTTF